MTRSLRFLLLAGLVVLNTVVLGAVAVTVYVHERREHRDDLEDDLRLRAKTLSALLNVDSDGREFEASPRATPEYMTPGSGAYMVIRDAAGKRVVTSPSLGDQTLEPSSPWSAGAFDFRETSAGPDGIPVETVTHSFLVQVEEPGGDGWQPPSDEERRYQIVVAADTRPRDAALARLSVFLLGMSLAALAATLAGGFLVARRVLAPIRSMTAEAATLTPQDPARRLHPESVVLELASLSATLNSALDRLGAALDRQRRFTSDASHELRTPMAVLLANVELLLQRERTADQYREGLERQRRTALRMKDITENLLALARADDGRTRLSRAPVDLTELTRSVCDEFTSLASEAGVALTCESGALVTLDGDAMYLAQVLQNLISNAVKFTPRGGSVVVGLRSYDGQAYLEVADTGPGIPEAERERVFERFHRVHEGKDRREGAGLGLAIVDWIVRAHGGTVVVRDREGGGAVIRVRLPLRSAEVGRGPVPR